MSDTTAHFCKNIPNLPSDKEGPVFAEPWQAQAFALAVRLCDEGHFTWAEWVETFSKQVKQAQAEGDPDLGDTYYNHWLNVLEKMVIDKSVVSSSDMKIRKEAWRQAYLRTPHGHPVEL
ncbi:nitrile hydratase accessory protein [Kiloniella antarctica]|uniref:Nitrile hydratase accessory protein n=1 Tax=Kiloniella antarctica TaxID=1550907 RepID=A0ABW5BMV4_9PROT